MEHVDGNDRNTAGVGTNACLQLAAGGLSATESSQERSQDGAAFDIGPACDARAVVRNITC